MGLTEDIKQVNSRVSKLKTTKARLEGQQDQIFDRVKVLCEALGVDIEEITQDLVVDLKSRLVNEQTRLQVQVDATVEKLNSIDALLKD